MPTEGDQDRPSTAFEYDFLAFVNSPPDQRQPIFVRTIRHEHHDTEDRRTASERDPRLKPSSTPTASAACSRRARRPKTCSLATGSILLFGNEVLPADQEIGCNAGAGSAVEAQPRGPPNVVVSGWQIYDNKGRVVEKFEPFFSGGFELSLAG